MRLEDSFRDVFAQPHEIADELDIVRVLEVTILAEQRYQRPAEDEVIWELQTASRTRWKSPAASERFFVTAAVTRNWWRSNGVRVPGSGVGFVRVTR